MLNEHLSVESGVVATAAAEFLQLQRCDSHAGSEDLFVQGDDDVHSSSSFIFQYSGDDVVAADTRKRASISDPSSYMNIPPLSPPRITRFPGAPGPRKAVEATAVPPLASTAPPPQPPLLAETPPPGLPRIARTQPRLSQPPVRDWDWPSAWAVPSENNPLAVDVKLATADNGDEFWFVVVIDLGIRGQFSTPRTFDEFVELQLSLAAGFGALRHRELIPAAFPPRPRAPLLCCGISSARRWGACRDALAHWLRLALRVRMRLPCSLFWRLAAFVGVQSTGLVDTLRASVTLASAATAQAAQTFTIQVGTERGATPSAVTVSFQALVELRGTLRRLDAAPKTRPFPSADDAEGRKGGRDAMEAGERDAIAAQLWLEDVVGRWWILPDGAKEALAQLLGMEPRDGEAPDDRHRMFSIDESLGKGCDSKANRSSLRAPLLS